MKIINHQLSIINKLSIIQFSVLIIGVWSLIENWSLKIENSRCVLSGVDNV